MISPQVGDRFRCLSSPWGRADWWTPGRVYQVVRVHHDETLEMTWDATNGTGRVPPYWCFQMFDPVADWCSDYAEVE